MSTPQSAPPRYAPTVTPQPGRLRSDLSTDLFNRPQAMLINQDIVPLHRVQPPSVLQPVYKWLLPHDIVRLAAGKESIIVIPTIEVVKQIMCVGIIHQFYTKKFWRIIKKTCRHINPVYRASLAEEALVEHALPSDDATIFQFCVRVVNYPERCHFELDAIHSQQVDMYWKQGAGINVAVCGYTTQATVLLQYKYVAFLEVYQLTQDDSYLNKRISFATTTNPCNLVAPLVAKLLLVEGCHFGTVELMWRFYWAQSAAKQLKLDRLETKQLKLDRLKKRFKSGGGILASDSTFIPKSNPSPDSLLTFIKFDLRDQNVNAFESFASNIYKQSFEMHYRGFPPVGFYLVE